MSRQAEIDALRAKDEENYASIGLEFDYSYVGDTPPAPEAAAEEPAP
jgi:hypothetical protein